MIEECEHINVRDYDPCNHCGTQDGHCEDCGEEVFKADYESDWEIG